MSKIRDVRVDASDWLSTFEKLKSEGLDYFDFLAATDLGDGQVAVTVHLASADVTSRALVQTCVPNGFGLESLGALYPAAKWHEREAHELVGVLFAHNDDLRPLTLDRGNHRPLRRASPLAARLSKPWPGLVEPGIEPDSTRRRRERVVPGIGADWVPTAEMGEL